MQKGQVQDRERVRGCHAILITQPSLPTEPLRSMFELAAGHHGAESRCVSDSAYVTGELLSFAKGRQTLKAESLQSWLSHEFGRGGRRG